MSGKTLYTAGDLPILSKKREAFCHEYMKNNFNHKLAYLSVYKNVLPSTASTEGSKLLKNPDIQIFIAHLQEQVRRAESISKSEIVQKLKTLIAKCEADEDRPNLLKALDQLNKIAGLYNDKPTINVQSEGDINISFGGWDPDQATASSQVVDYIQSDDITDITPEGVDPLS